MTGRPPIVPEAGARFGWLTFERILDKRYHSTRVGLFVCDCGRGCELSIAHVRDGGFTSCGCRRGWHRKVHGMAHTTPWRSWLSMIARCKYPKDKNYARYGGRGIRVCERWLVFANFLADMGPRPIGAQLHRKDNDGDYELGNCEWLPRSEHSRLSAKSLPRRGSRWASREDHAQ